MKFLLALILLSSSSGNDLRGKSRNLGYRNYNLIHKKSAENVESKESDITTLVDVQHIDVDEEIKDDSDNEETSDNLPSPVDDLYEDDEDYHYDNEIDQNDDEKGLDYDEDYAYDDDDVYEYADDDDDEDYNYDEYDDYSGDDNDYDYNVRPVDSRRSSKQARPHGDSSSYYGSNGKHSKPYPRIQDKFYDYDYGYDYDYDSNYGYDDESFQNSYVRDVNYFDEDKYLTILVGENHYYTCNKYCIEHNAENFERGECSRCNLVEINGNLDVRCEGKIISRSCRNQCCEPKGGTKIETRGWNNDMEAVYDHDKNYADEILVTRVGDFFFTCDKFCINSEEDVCHACDVDANLHVRCDRGIVPQGCRQECCTLGDSERAKSINNHNEHVLEVVHNYKSIAKDKDSLVCLARGELIDCSISCIDDNAVRRCYGCEVDVFGDVWCEDREVHAPCIHKCCNYMW